MGPVLDGAERHIPITAESSTGQWGFGSQGSPSSFHPTRAWVLFSPQVYHPWSIVKSVPWDRAAFLLRNKIEDNRKYHSASFANEIRVRSENLFGFMQFCWYTYTHYLHLCIYSYISAGSQCKMHSLLRVKVRKRQTLSLWCDPGLQIFECFCPHSSSPFPDDSNHKTVRRDVYSTASHTGFPPNPIFPVNFMSQFG